MDTSRILREVIIVLLLILVIIFAFGILFYDCISADRDAIYSEEYIVDEDVSEVLNEISEDSGIDAEENTLLQTYSVTQEDLENYAKEQGTYESGKKDPFAESSEETSGSSTTVTVTASSKSTNSQTTDSTQTNSSSEENTTTSTTGTFFEQKDSK